MTNEEFSDAVTRLLGGDALASHINKAGFSPWVHVQHASGRRGTASHDSGWRWRIAREVSGLTSDQRLGIQPEGPLGATAEWVPAVNVLSFPCACGASVRVAELKMLKLTVSSLFRDTRSGARYVCQVR